MKDKAEDTIANEKAEKNSKPPEGKKSWLGELKELLSPIFGTEFRRLFIIWWVIFNIDTILIITGHYSILKDFYAYFQFDCFDLDVLEFKNHQPITAMFGLPDFAVQIIHFCLFSVLFPLLGMAFSFRAIKPFSHWVSKALRKQDWKHKAEIEELDDKQKSDMKRKREDREFKAEMALAKQSDDNAKELRSWYSKVEWIKRNPHIIDSFRKDYPDYRYVDVYWVILCVYQKLDCIKMISPYIYIEDVNKLPSILRDTDTIHSMGCVLKPCKRFGDIIDNFYHFKLCPLFEPGTIIHIDDLPLPTQECAEAIWKQIEACCEFMGEREFKAKCNEAKKN